MPGSTLIKWLCTTATVFSTLLFAQGIESRGTDFWVMFQENGPESSSFSLAISGEPATAGTVTAAGINFQENFTLPANGLTYVTLPGTVVHGGSDFVSDRGIHIESDKPVAVQGYDNVSMNGDAFTALPFDLLDMEYFMISSPLTEGAASRIGIVSPFEDNQISITFQGSEIASAVLNRGDTYQILRDFDLSGAMIRSSLPVAVFGGELCNFAGAVQCGYTTEQLTPSVSWGNRHYLTPFANIINLNRVKVIAEENDTDVYWNGQLVSTLAAGGVYESILESPSEIRSGDPEKGLQVIQLAQEIESANPNRFMSIIPATDQFLSGYTYATPPGESGAHFVNIIAPLAGVGNIILDQVVISSENFQPIGESGYAAATIQISPGVHRLTSANRMPFGFYGYGYGELNGYGLPGGIGLSNFFDVNVSDLPKIGETLTIDVEAPENFDPLFSFICYRPGGQQEYTISNLSQVDGGYRGIIPAEFMTERGVEYHISFSDGLVQRTFPPKDAEQHPIALVLAGDEYVTPQVSLQEFQYKMISVPMTLNNPFPLAVLGDELGDYDPQRWRLFRWYSFLETDGQYRELPDFEEEGEGSEGFLPGRAFWVITSKDTMFDVDLARTQSSADSQRILLLSGWNQIGNPFAFPVAWDSISADESLIGPYYFDGSEFLLDDRLRPWEGCFVFNPGSAIILTIPPIAMDANTSLAKTASVTQLDFKLRIRAEAVGTDIRDTQNFIGATPAVYGESAMNYPEPPAIQEKLGLSILAEEERFMQHVKSHAAGGAIWDLELRSNGLHDGITLTFVEELALPAGYNIYLFDKERFNILSERNGQYLLHPDEDGRHDLRLIIGTEMFARNNNEGIPLQPVSYELGQNYPNPFNPETTIRFKLQQREQVLLTIYNTLGQKVRTLVNDVLNTGTHAVSWDGRDDQGRAVASSIYLYRLQAGSFSETRKMTLIR